jgi:hypothetical protein
MQDEIVLPDPAENPSPNPPPSSSKPTDDPLAAELARLNNSSSSSLARDLAETRAKNAMLESRLAALEATNRKPEPSGADFINDPIPLLRKELQDTVAPLVQFVNKFDKRDKYTELKNSFIEQFPAMGSKLKDHEAIVDHLMSLPNMEPTPQNLQAALVQAIGIKTLQGDVATPKSNTPPVPSTTVTPVATTVIPPNIPPAPPTVPQGVKATPESVLKAKIDALTEDERTAARVMGFSMSPEGLAEYIHLRDADSNVSTWDRPGAKK